MTSSKEPYISAEERYDPAKEQNKKKWVKAPLHITSFQAQMSVTHQAPQIAPFAIYPQTKTWSHTPRSPSLEPEQMQGILPNTAQTPYISANEPHISADEPYISANKQNGESPLWYIPQANDLSAQTHTYVSQLPRALAEEIPKAMTRGTLVAGVLPQGGSEGVDTSQYQTHFPSVRAAYTQHQLESLMPGVQQQQRQIWQQHAAWPQEQHASEVVGDIGGGSGRGAQEDAGRELRAASWILHLLNAAH